MSEGGGGGSGGVGSWVVGVENGEAGRVAGKGRRGGGVFGAPPSAYPERTLRTVQSLGSHVAKSRVLDDKAAGLLSGKSHRERWAMPSSRA